MFHYIYNQESVDYQVSRLFMNSRFNGLGITEFGLGLIGLGAWGWEWPVVTSPGIHHLVFFS